MTCEELQVKPAQIQALDEQNAQLMRQVVEERNRSEAMAAASADGVMVIDSDRNIVLVNAALEKLTGYSAEDLIGKPCTHLFDACDSTGQCLCDFSCPHLGSDRLPGRTVYVTIETKEAKRVWVGITTAVVREEKSGDIRCVVHTLRDMTKEKEAERMRDEFISVASHELMTPLTSLKGFAQLAHRIGVRSAGNGSLMRALEILNEEADKLVTLVTRLVDASRLEAKKLELTKSDFELIDLSEVVVKRLGPTADKHDFRLTGERPVVVHGDREKIEQVLTHIVGNAIKYSPDGGSIEVRIDRQEGFVQVSVSDQGIGIPAEKQAHVFERFYQAHSGPRGYSKGMGIGLHICREIISLHGGQIWVRSEEGKGSAFHFTLLTSQEDPPEL
ncbi:MAG: cell wall metabolism sensor histidine kinase WalK [Chloroflexi bacterium]|nr:cell wall metabolism sensor histidine kinase WalK [Chloroflexota bacterium]